MNRSLGTAVLGLSFALGACAAITPARPGALIEHYAQSACIPARQAPASVPHEWSQMVHADDRCYAHVMAAEVGARSANGFVLVEYPVDHVRRAVAAFGEKSGPVDVRFDAASCRLFVRSTGVPAFTDGPATWLVEYDVRQRREVQSVVVEPRSLPTSCPVTPPAT